MRSMSLLLISLQIVSLFVSSQASALTLSEFRIICESSPVECKDHPVLQAYVGGALDVIAGLTEDTNYLKKIYCEDASTLFDVKEIIPFMQQYEREHESINAMLVLIRYLEKKGGC